MASDKLIVSVSGLRGVVGESLTPEVIVRYVAVCAGVWGAGPVLVSRDGRPSGLAMSRIVEGTLTLLGRPVLSGGIMATPTVGVLTRQWQLAGAIQVTASHNPPPYNGLKVFEASGRVVPPSLGEKIREHFHRAPSNGSWVPYDQIGMLTLTHDTVRDHLARVLATVDMERIRSRQFRVLLDCNHGAGSQLALPLLEALGCQTICIGSTPDGQFAHPPEPTEENLREVGQRVVDAGADIGFCQDPDADRLAIIDEHGNYIGEEYTLALCVAHRLQSQAGPVVINGATSRMIEDLCRQFGVPCVRTSVGEAHVVSRMQEVAAVYGGEGNGGPIDPRVGWVRDSFVGMAQVLDFLAAANHTVSQLVATLPRYAMCKSRLESISPQQLQKAFAQLEHDFSDALRVDRSDGLRWEWDDRWLLVRGSNTEPIVRFIAEAPSAEEASQLVEKAKSCIRGEGGR